MDSENKPKIEEEKIDLLTVVKTTIKNWPWIIASVVFFVVIGLAYILVTPTKYERTSQILLKDESKNRNVPSQLAALVGMGMIGASNGFSIEDEMSKMKSPDSYREVIDRLGIHTVVSENGMLKDRQLYGENCPVIVTLPDIDDNEEITFDLTVEGNNATISKLRKDDEKVDNFNSQSFALGSSVKTPVGAIKVEKNPGYKPEKDEKETVDFALNVKHPAITEAIDELNKEINIATLSKQSNVVEFKVIDENPKRGELILTTLVDVYNDIINNRRNSIAQVTEDFINNRLKQVMTELGDVENTLSSYQSQTLMPDAQKAAQLYLEENKEQEKKILEVSNQLEMARYIQQYLSNAAHRNQVLPANSVDANSSLEKQISQYNELILTRNRLADNSSETHPKVVQLDDEIQGMRNAILSSVNNSVAGYETTLKGLKNAQGKALSRITNAPGQAMHLLELGREQKVKQEIYLYLLQKREENEISLISNSTHPEVILKPYGKMRPVAPRKVMILGICFVIGLLVPFGYNFCKEAFS